MTKLREVDFQNQETPEADLLSDALAGLSESPKTLPCKYFYDEAGSLLFDEICELDEYYPTRTELSIMERSVSEMAETLGEDVLLVEYGSGSSLKTRILLDHLKAPRAYVPVDISGEHLARSAAALAERHPEVAVWPICADFTSAFSHPRASGSRPVVYFPGSTIGNLTPDEALSFLSDVATRCGVGGGLLIGVDLVKDIDVLERAYNDRAGVTARFNKNLLVRLNREAGADFDLDEFSHRAIWNSERFRIEMHLVSERDQEVRLGARTIIFAKGETIHTENSHKYELDAFASIARTAGFAEGRVWTDERRWFSVQYWSVA